jgi:vancomycin resistance protein YoaR
LSILLFIGIVFILSFEIAYVYKIYPRTYVGNIEVTGKTKDRAVKYLTEKTDPIIINGLEFVWKDKSANIDTVITGPSAGDVYEKIYSYDIRETVNRAYDYGHVGGWGRKLSEQFDSIFNKNIIPIKFNLNEEGLEEILRENFLEMEKPAIEADLKISVRGGNAVIHVEEEISGQTFDYKKAIAEAKDNILNLRQKDIVLQTMEDEPKVKKADVKKVIPLIQEVINLSPITFTYGRKTIELSKPELASWLKLEKIYNPESGAEVKLIINKEEAEKFLSTTALDIDIEPLDAKFEIVDERVTQFQSNRAGLKLDIEQTLQKIAEKIFKEKINTIELVVEEIEPKIKNIDVNDLGIVELIGRGISDFSGSTTNRIHNITNGAKTLNGIIIKPDETFSVNSILGDIDAESGYLPELVIKGNKTIPEYGGGLCQIGTTTFRAALQTGLPILERRHHSYDVKYYSPTGTDATIYGPHPDVRFLNDTGNHILFLTSVENPKLIFEFWGTKDGRKIKFIGKEETSDFAKLVPVVYNTIKPGAPKYIETDTLAPGQKERIEYSYRGADAKFDYIVTYPNEEIKEETFNSHYIPWREVWLVGVEKIAEETEEAAEELD